MVTSAVLLDLSLSDLESQNLDRTNLAPYMYKIAKITLMFH